MMRSYFIASTCLVALLVAVYSAHAEPEHHQLQPQHQQHQALSNDEYKNRLVQLLLSDLESADSTEQDAVSSDSDEDGEQMDKRMSYRYGKRMSYRYGKRSAMPYRFGKRGNGFYPSAQHIIDYIKMHENDDSSDVNKRMSYRYGRSSD